MSGILHECCGRVNTGHHIRFLLPGKVFDPVETDELLITHFLGTNYPHLANWATGTTGWSLLVIFIPLPSSVCFRGLTPDLGGFEVFCQDRRLGQ